MISDSEEDYLIRWLNEFNLPKKIKNKVDIRRESADAVLFAKIIKQTDFSLVQIINYIPSCNLKQKKTNWDILNKKVLKKLGCPLSDFEINGIINMKDSFAENALYNLKDCLDEYKDKQIRKIEDEKIIKEQDDSEEDSEKPSVKFNRDNFYKNEIFIRKEKINDLMEKIKVK